MNRKFLNKFNGIILILLLLISVVTTPLSMVVYAVDGDVKDSVIVEEQAYTVESKEKEKEKGDKSIGEETVVEDVSEESAGEVHGTVVEEDKELDEEEPETGVVEFEDDALRETVAETLEIYDRDITISDRKELNL